MRYARKAQGNKIKAAVESPKSTVWRVCRDGFCEENYLKEEYEKAAARLVRIYKERLKSEATDWIEQPYGYANFEQKPAHMDFLLAPSPSCAKPCAHPAWPSGQCHTPRLAAPLKHRP